MREKINRFEIEPIPNRGLNRHSETEVINHDIDCRTLERS